MTKRSAYQQIEVALCDLLGLDARTVKRISFDFAAGEVPRVDVVHWVRPEQAAAFEEVLRSYTWQLVEDEIKPEPAPV